MDIASGSGPGPGYNLFKLSEVGNVMHLISVSHVGPVEGQQGLLFCAILRPKLEAEKAIQCLIGKMALSKKLVRYDNYKSEKVFTISLETVFKHRTNSVHYK
ncbi:unnamed protein product, partial [Ranitomeya imitator]